MNICCTSVFECVCLGGGGGGEGGSAMAMASVNSSRHFSNERLVLFPAEGNARKNKNNNNN